MKTMLSVFIIVSLCFTGVYNAGTPPAAKQNQIYQQEEKKLSEVILSVVEHYKQKDPVGIPGAPIPDPLPVQDMTRSFSVGTMKMKNMQLHGMKHFRIVDVKLNIAKMSCQAALSIDKLVVRGNYTMSSFFSSSKGPFTITMTGVYVTANATLEVRRSGKLEAEDMSMDVVFKDMKMDFTNLGAMFQSIINSVGTSVFETIKPSVMGEVNEQMRHDVNKQIEQLNQTFPNSISPLDQLITTVRHEIRRQGYDPWQLKDYNTSVGVCDVYLRHTWVHGLSSIHRNGDIVFEMRNNTIYINVDIGTQKLKGSTQWEVAFVAGLVSKAGTASFTINHLKVQLVVSQSTDVRNRPKLEDIQLELGNIQMRFDGTGTLDYVIEFGVNVIPNILRFQIMDAIEGPLKKRIQEVLDTVDVENIIEKNVNKLDGGAHAKFFK